MSNWFRRLRSFLSDDNEWHALVDGFCIVFYPLLLAVPEIRWEISKSIKGELHYFVFGAFLGVCTIIGFITLMLYILI